jgi:hypothetical protein
MNRYEKSSYLLGDSDVSLNENKQYKTEKKLDFVIETLESITKYSPIEESHSLEVADKLFKIDELLNQIRPESLDEMDVSTLGLTGAVLSGITGVLSVVGAKTVLNAWINGNVVPTKLANIFFDIKQYLAGQDEKSVKYKKLKEGLQKRFPNASEKTIDTMIKRALEEAPKRKGPDNDGRWALD